MNRTLLLAATVCIAVACNLQETNTTMWPSHAMRGQTVALPIDSNHVYPGLDQWDLSKSNLEIELDWGAPGPPGIATIGEADGLRVIEAWSHPSAIIDSILAPPFDTRAWIAIAVFAVPDDTVILSVPVTATVRPLKDGNPILAYPPAVDMEATLEIIPGTPTQMLLPDPEDLAPPPLLRVVGVAAQDKFDPAWSDGDQADERLIGSIEFELAYPGTLTVKAAYQMTLEHAENSTHFSGGPSSFTASTPLPWTSQL
jgi:hypothetical protein